MNTKRLLLSFGLLAGLAFPLVAAEPSRSSTVEVNFENSEKFTDVKDSYGASERTNESYLRTLKEHLERTATKRLPAGQRLSVTITDIDMAGDFEPWRAPQFQDVRIVKDIYPPRIDLSFRLTDANGTVLAEGQRELRDLSFNMRTGLPTNDTLRHEKALLDDWLRRELRQAAKKS